MPSPKISPLQPSQARKPPRNLFSNPQPTLHLPHRIPNNPPCNTRSYPYIPESTESIVLAPYNGDVPRVEMRQSYSKQPKAYGIEDVREDFEDVHPLYELYRTFLV
ncbi:hypothetical protein D9611_010273 [Ephemerocybe angulata]|uniref:Uncharacterized protein n=1 Tax=Ephemerocybe angulata TaxID=980116 RepID=A0A8H5F1I9_9AGAR|nr:hypothetical protein D9611_010273 [Tulosesus angulatus]